MNEATDPRTDAERDLARVEAKVEAARAVLVRLLQEVVVAESRLGKEQTAQMLHANEELVLAALHSQELAEAAERNLAEASQAGELDALTQVPNRRVMHDRLEYALVQARRQGARLGLLFVDLDNFKRLNDSLGHAFGDRVLTAVARGLVGAVREADTVSRHGGDEFLILLAEIKEPADARRVAEKVNAALADTRPAAGAQLRLSASIGISVGPDDGDDADTLIDRADAAMYAAKAGGPGRIAMHGEGAPPGPAAAPEPAPAHGAGRGLAAQEMRMKLLREANEKLVLAVLGAQELQAAAEQARHRQSEFMAAVAQELANPLAPIRVATAMLGRERGDEPLLPRLQALIAQQMESTQRLVAAVHEVSRAGAAPPASTQLRVDLRGIVEAAVQACTPAIEARQQRLSVQLPATPVLVLGDASSLVQIFVNLLDNASKYGIEQGRIDVELQSDGALARVAVEDDGIGITAAALPTLFQAFAQDLPAIGYNGVGMGIGLTVVRSLATSHGGSVSAASAGRGHGSRFVVTLPLASVAARGA